MAIAQVVGGLVRGLGRAARGTRRLIQQAGRARRHAAFRKREKQANDAGIDLNDVADILLDPDADKSEIRKAQNQLDIYEQQRDYLTDLGIHPDRDTNKFVFYGGPQQGVRAIYIDFWLTFCGVIFRGKRPKVYTYVSGQPGFIADVAASYYGQGDGLTRYLIGINRSRFLPPRRKQARDADVNSRLTERARRARKRELNIDRGRISGRRSVGGGLTRGPVADRRVVLNPFALDRSREGWKRWARYERSVFWEQNRSGSLSDHLVDLDRHLRYSRRQGVAQAFGHLFSGRRGNLGFFGHIRRSFRNPSRFRVPHR